MESVQFRRLHCRLILSEVFFVCLFVSVWFSDPKMNVSCCRQWLNLNLLMNFQLCVVGRERYYDCWSHHLASVIFFLSVSSIEQLPTDQLLNSIEYESNLISAYPPNVRVFERWSVSCSSSFCQFSLPFSNLSRANLWGGRHALLPSLLRRLK